MVKKVYIVGGDNNYKTMFQFRGWAVTHKLSSASLIQFTGGEDITPSLYKEIKHPATNYNLMRDMRESILFNIAVKKNIPMAGICRGGQFLNVMNGGGMWQHVDGHAGVGCHKAVDMESGESFLATSTHHQMMKPTKEAILVTLAGESSQREKVGKQGTILILRGFRDKDIEVVYYDKHNSLCFQPHPEFKGFPELTDRYFQYINKYLGI